MKKQLLAALLGAIVTATAFQLAWPAPTVIHSFIPNTNIPDSDFGLIHPPYEQKVERL
jgi:hypothetical protein